MIYQKLNSIKIILMMHLHVVLSKTKGNFGHQRHFSTHMMMHLSGTGWIPFPGWFVHTEEGVSIVHC